jgi:hypothetical protein
LAQTGKEIEELASLVDVGIVPEALVDIFPSAPEKSSATIFFVRWMFALMHQAC